MVYKGGEIMNDEQIKEILIALINKGEVLTGADNTEIAKNMAIFINTLKEELKEGKSLKSNMTMEEIVERVQNDVVIDFDDDDIDYNDTDDTSIY